MSVPTGHFREAERALEQADYIANADNWRNDQRAADVANALAKAQVHATLAVAMQLAEMPVAL